MSSGIEYFLINIGNKEDISTTELEEILIGDRHIFRHQQFNN